MQGAFIGGVAIGVWFDDGMTVGLSLPVLLVDRLLLSNETGVCHLDLRCPKLSIRESEIMWPRNKGRSGWVRPYGGHTT